MGIERSARPAARGWRHHPRSRSGLERSNLVRRLGRAPRWVKALAAIALGLAILAIGFALFADESVRRLIQQRMNDRLHGYRAEIGRVELRPLCFGMDVLDLTVARSDRLDQPIARVSELTVSVEWRALLRGAVVADATLRRPILYVDRTQVEREVRDGIALRKRGWQDAIQALSPFEINEVRVHDGEATYVDDGPFEPLRLTAVQAQATNIRNILSRDREYPSELSLDATVFERGRLGVRGRADFLAKPVPGVSASVELEGIAVEYFRPILERHHFTVRDGTLSLSGELELGRTIRTLRIRELVLNGFVGDYLRTPVSAAKEPEVARKAVHAAREAAERPELRLRADRIELRDAEFGVVSAAEAYRVFLSGADLELENFSNRFSEGTGRARLRGRFMGSGSTDVVASFEPERSGPEFDLEVRIVDTELPALNDLLRAHGNFDVAAGLFSLYAEIRVEDGRVDGYVKPLFRDVQVHDTAQDGRDGLVRKTYERLIAGAAEVLENRPRDEVATRTDLSGPLTNPRMSTWELLGKLVQNAFFDAILPGFERETGRGRRAD